MPEAGGIDTSIYKSIAPPANPLQMLPAAEQVNRLSLFPLVQRQQEAATKEAELGLAGHGLDFARQGVAALAGNPNLSKRDVIDYLTSLSRQPGMGVVPTQQFINEVNGLPNDRKSLMDWVTRQQTAAIGPGAGAGEAVIGVTPEGREIKGTVAQRLRKAVNLDQQPGAAAIPGSAPALGSQTAQQPGQGYVTAQPPGFEERQKGAALTDVKLADDLSREIEGAPQRRALLGNIMDLADKFTPGPGAAESKTVKAFINRNIPLPEGWKFDQKSIASQEEFAKQAAQFAQKQFDTIGGTGTDAKFNSAFTVSPNEALSKMGIKGISRLLLGNEDAIKAKNDAWLRASAADPSLSYRRFSSDFSSRFDPRVFQFKYIPQAEREKYIENMDRTDRKTFLQNLVYAHKQKLISFPISGGEK